MRFSRRSWLQCLIALPFSAPFRAWGESSLVFAVYPYLSPTQIATFYSPLRERLALALDRPISMRSAPDFTQFVQRLRAEEYDIAVVAPHIGRHAQKRFGYRVLAQTGYRIQIVTVVRREAPIRSLADLRGKSLAVGARLSIAYQLMEKALTENGLVFGRDVRFVDTAGFSNVLEAVQRGDADAGATGTPLWEMASSEFREALREIYKTPEVPGFFVIAHPRLGNALLLRLASELYGFAATPQGKVFFEGTHLIDFRPVTEATLQSLDPYTKVFDER